VIAAMAARVSVVSSAMRISFGSGRDGSAPFD